MDERSNNRDTGSPDTQMTDETFSPKQEINLNHSTN